MRLKFWVDLVEAPSGFYDDDEGLNIVEVFDHPEQLSEPGPTLRDIEAMLRYIGEQLPDGWQIDDDGRVVKGDASLRTF